MIPRSRLPRSIPLLKKLVPFSTVECLLIFSWYTPYSDLLKWLVFDFKESVQLFAWPKDWVAQMDWLFGLGVQLSGASATKTVSDIVTNVP